MLALLLILLNSGNSLAHTNAPHFESYANAFQSAIVSKDLAKLRSLSGKNYVLSESNIEYAFGASKDVSRRTMREILSSSDTTTIIEISKVNELKWIARIYFVVRKRMKNPHEPSLRQVYDLKRDLDYSVCEVIFEKGNYSMRDHFCYDEVDI